ncbi:hypothetical protein FQA39_LY02929 [Lamprigera yunnana]|nr:hypothetical protein FQA39_LY02929 [Lamprigera yunnana]
MDKEEDNKVLVERHFEAGPPEGLELVLKIVLQSTLLSYRSAERHHDKMLQPTPDIYVVVVEKWVSKKTTEVTNTKQIETRVKRQVVLQDGKVVEDSGPMVTTNTTEETETQEHRHTEHRKLGEDDDAEDKQLEDVKKESRECNRC